MARTYQLKDVDIYVDGKKLTPAGSDFTIEGEFSWAADGDDDPYNVPFHITLWLRKPILPPKQEYYTYSGKTVTNLILAPVQKKSVLIGDLVTFGGEGPKKP